MFSGDLTVTPNLYEFTMPIVAVKTAPEKESLNGVPDLMVLKNPDGLAWKDFRRQLKPDFGVVIANIFFSWSMIALGVLGFAALNLLRVNWLPYAFIPFGGLWFAFWMQSYSSHFHESAHFNFAPRHLNDSLSRIFLTPFIGLDVKSYRISHWQHHRFLGDPRDTEISYHEPLTLQRILEGFSGLYLLRSLARYLRNYRRTGQMPAAPGRETSKAFFFLPIAYAFCVQSVILFLLYRFISLPAALAWGSGLLLFGSFLSILRQTLEHRSLDAPEGIDFKKVPHGAVNRLFGCDLFSRNFGGAGFNRHLLHHWDPNISYTCFDELETFLLETAAHDEMERQRTTYWKAFREMFRWS